ncbi:MAG: cation-translocating P-type ATPase [Telluria sp.]|nr:cation-translocating P-type ATPase [Telluria sp.]
MASTRTQDHADRSGLSAAEAARRLAAEGPNQLPSPERRSLLRIVRESAHEPMFLLLLGGGLLYLVLGEPREGMFLFAMVGLILGLTLYQQGKTEHALDALRELSSPRALVLRDGKTLRIDSRELVRGDLLVLAEGERVAADAILVSGNEVLADESQLTGESEPVRKLAATGAPPPARPGGHDLPYLYCGSLLVKGHGTARVTATGARSEIGRIGAALRQLPPEASPLQRQTRRLVARFALLGLALSLALVVFYGLRHGHWLQALLAGIAMAMAMLPEEFAVVLTVFPALGAWRLARANVLTRRLAAIETLGATSVLCVDKTGTLTENRMTVTSLYADGEHLALEQAAHGGLPERFHALAEYAILASAEAPFDPMEKAFHRLAGSYLRDTEHLHPDWTLANEYALTPQLRAMSHAWDGLGQDRHVVAAKGSPEAIIDLCHLEPAGAQAVLAAADAMAHEGLRVLGVARAKHAGAALPRSQHEFDFSFVGLVGLADPLRPDVPAALRQCREAGIRVIMITGDYPATASAVARRAGLDPGVVLGGEELAAMSEAQLRERIRTAGVCARIAPDQKLRIVQALKANGAIVAMTGDGVNDAPALKAAHVGVAMGLRGTEVAREAGALVLLDDRFMSIVQAVRAGRLIFSNMQKSMSYILAVHVAIAGMALLPVLLGWPVLLYPMHIVFLQLVIDPACSLAFENEPPEPDLMRTAPRNARAPLFGPASMLRAGLQGASALAVVLAAYAWAGAALPQPQARAFAFSALVAANLAQILSNRSQHRSAIAVLRAPNPVLWSVAAAALALLLLVLYQGTLAAMFRFAPLGPSQLAAALGIGASAIVLSEALKLARRRGRA